MHGSCFRSNLRPERLLHPGRITACRRFELSYVTELLLCNCGPRRRRGKNDFLNIPQQKLQTLCDVVIVFVERPWISTLRSSSQGCMQPSNYLAESTELCRVCP